MSSTRKLAGQVAVVTGASKGIGAQIAKALAAEGASVVVNYASSKADADKVVAAITAAGGGGKAIAVQADVSKLADIGKLFEQTKQVFGKLDILVNNAGIYNFAPLEAITADDFHRQFNLNVLGLLLTTQAAVPYFNGTGGRVINVSSIVSRLGLPGSSVYAATKASVDAITRALGAELGPKNIRINAVNPGMIETEGTASQGITQSDFAKATVAATPLGRIGKVDDIAPVVVFLAGDESKWMTGETLYVAGGYR